MMMDERPNSDTDDSEKIGDDGSVDPLAGAQSPSRTDRSSGSGDNRRSSEGSGDNR